jgi:uncharacterized protein YbaR (Trm112 family)
MLSQSDRIKLSTTVQQHLRCPICKSKLELHDEHYQCENHQCKYLFPVVNGIPVFIDENNSLFSIDDFINQRTTVWDLSIKPNKFKAALLHSIL